MKEIFLDAETYSDLDLTKCGVYRYVESEHFELLLLSVNIDNEGTKVFDLACGEKLPNVIIEAIKNQEKAEGIKAVTFEQQKATREVTRKSYEDLMKEMQELGEKMAESGHLEDLQLIVSDNLGADKKASELKRGQEQQIETIIYDIQSFLADNNIE